MGVAANGVGKSAPISPVGDGIFFFQRLRRIIVPSAESPGSDRQSRLVYAWSELAQKEQRSLATGGSHIFMGTIRLLGHIVE